MKWLDRAATKFGHLAIPNLLQAVVSISALVYILSKIYPHYLGTLDLKPQAVVDGQIWRLVTYIFIPRIGGFFFGDVIGAVFYILFQWWIANGLESAMGSFRVNVYFLLGMIATTVAAFFFGAAYSNFALITSLFFAFAHYYPDEIIYLMWVLPVRVKWLAWLDAAIVFVMLVLGNNQMRMALLVSFTNYLVFFGPDSFRQARLHGTAVKRRRKFQAAMASDEESMHRCAVCGRTENSSPDLEFRVAKDGNEYCLEHLPKTAN